MVGTLYCSDIRDWLKTQNPKFKKYYAGKLDDKYDQSICVYDLNEYNRREIAAGGLDNTLTRSKSFSVLIHYNKNYTETEKVAETLYDTIGTSMIGKREKIGDYTINYIEMLTEHAIDVHTSENGIYERVIEFRVYFSKPEQNK